MSASGAPPKASVVLYPSPGMGHLVSMFELAKLLDAHDLTVTVLILEPYYNTGSTAPFIARASASNPAISFHRLPSVTPPPSPSRHQEALTFDLLRLSNPNLSIFLHTSRPSALVIDFFCTCSFEVAAELNLPTYVFWASPASFLAVLLHFPILHDSTSASFRELGPTCKLEIPGTPPIPADHMPLPMLDRGDVAYEECLTVSRRLTEAKGFIVNTVHELEKRAVDTIAAGPYPRPHCIGPLVSSGSGDDGGRPDYLSWLARQPERSVVFLCFGSIGKLAAEQLTEIAVGLEKSGQRFLWVVRSPPSPDPAYRFSPPPEPDLERLLPAGFLGRTEGRGMVVKSWAPQAAVLAHVSVGGFVTHCGWNSVLEAICGGVPMIGWPLYAEQWINLVLLAEEMGLAVEMKGYDEAMVGAEEVETKVRWLMESDGGRELRERTRKAKAAAAAAAAEGGSSHKALVGVVEELRGE